MQTCQRNSIPSNLHSNSVQVGPNDWADYEDGDLEGPKDESKMPDLQTLADSLSGEERGLNCENMSHMKVIIKVKLHFNIIYEAFN